MNILIIICGGAFQGKSLLALELACKFRIPLIINTDAIRTILHLQQPNNPIFATSTYQMKKEDFYKQKIEVSKMLDRLISFFYETRGESIIIEGMHLSNDFISQMEKRKNTVIMCIDNKAPFEERLLYKRKTRKKLKIRKMNDQKFELGEITIEKIHSSPYFKKRHRIEEIHYELLEQFEKHRLPIVTFEDFHKLIEKACKIIEEYDLK